MTAIDNIMALALNYRLAGSASRDEHEEALRTALTEALAPKLEQVPDAYQFRMRADWVTNWGEWAACNKAQHEMYIRAPKLHDWHYETRALFAAAPKGVV